MIPSPANDAFRRRLLVALTFAALGICFFWGPRLSAAVAAIDPVLPVGPTTPLPAGSTNSRVVAGHNLIIRSNFENISGSRRWYHNNVLLPGENGNSLAIVGADAADAGSYLLSVSVASSPIITLETQLLVEPSGAGGADTSFDASRLAPLNKDWPLVERPDGSWVTAELTSNGIVVFHFYTHDFVETAKISHLLDYDGIGYYTLVSVRSLTSDHQGRLYVAADFKPMLRSGLWRLTSTGEIDPSWPESSLGLMTPLGRVWVDDDDSVHLLKWTTMTSSVVHYRDDGTDLGGHASSVDVLARQRDGMIYGLPQPMLGKMADKDAVVLYRMSSSGTVDPSFSVNGLVKASDGTVCSLTKAVAVDIAPDGDIVILVLGEDPVRYALLRVRPDGGRRWAYCEEMGTLSRAGLLGVDPSGGAFLSCESSAGTEVRRISSGGVVTYREKLLKPSLIASSDGCCYLRYRTDASSNSYIGSARRLFTEETGKLQLTGLAGRARPGQSRDTLSVGFITRERGPVVLRALGPQMRDAGFAGADSDPSLGLYTNGALIGANDDWSSSELEIKQEAFAKIGLPPLPIDSKDAALALAVDPGAFSYVVQSKDSVPGVVVGEAYDGSNDGKLLRALALRGRSGQGEKVLIGGFILGGSGGGWVLIRGLGPELAAAGVADCLTDPQLLIYDSAGKLVAENDNWSTGDNGLLVSAAARKLGMSLLPASSLDAATLVWLRPGAYTAVVRGKNGGEGNAMIELYPLF